MKVFAHIPPLLFGINFFCHGGRNILSLLQSYSFPVSLILILFSQVLAFIHHAPSTHLSTNPSRQQTVAECLSLSHVPCRANRAKSDWDLGPN